MNIVTKKDSFCFNYYMHIGKYRFRKCLCLRLLREGKRNCALFIFILCRKFSNEIYNAYFDF